MKDKTQRISGYIAHSGLKVYEVEQYNKSADEWYIVGDSSTSREYIMASIQMHNLKLNK